MNRSQQAVLRLTVWSQHHFAAETIAMTPVESVPSELNRETINPVLVCNKLVVFMLNCKNNQAMDH